MYNEVFFYSRDTHTYELNLKIKVFHFKWIIIVVWPGGATTKYVDFNVGHEQTTRPIWTIFLIHSCNLRSLIYKTIKSFNDQASKYGDFVLCNLWMDSLQILFSSVTYIYTALKYDLSVNYTIYFDKNRTDFTTSTNLYGGKS